MADIRIATRRSALALAQALWVARALESAHRGLEIELVEVTTSGDSDQTSSLVALTETGAFVRSVQQAVLDGRADIAVHSCKDLPVLGPDELVAVYPEREVPWDVLCGGRLDELEPGARVGTGSPRRRAQLTAIRPDLVVEDVRGNVDTRLRKVDRGELDAVILAEAGLRRLGRSHEISHRFALSEMVPAPAQAALAVEAIRDGDAGRLVASIDDRDTRRCVEAERAVLAMTGAGCRAALGALATVDTGGLHLAGFVHDERGPRSGEVGGGSSVEAAERLIAALEL